MHGLQERLCCIGPSHWQTSEISRCPVLSKDKCLSSEYSYAISYVYYQLKSSLFGRNTQFLPQVNFDILSLLLLLFLSVLSHWHINTHSLEERKEQWRKEEEERRRNAPDPATPAGHTLMPESERQETLQSLKESMPLLLLISTHVVLMLTLKKYTICTVNIWLSNTADLFLHSSPLPGDRAAGAPAQSRQSECSLTSSSSWL